MCHCPRAVIRIRIDRPIFQQKNQSTFHQINVVKCFSSLSVRFRTIITRHCSRHCSQTIESLRMMTFACRFMAKLYDIVYPDVVRFRFLKIFSPLRAFPIFIFYVVSGCFKKNHYLLQVIILTRLEGVCKI